MKIFLVRHGQTDWNVERRMQGYIGVELNTVGISQAERLAEKFKDIPLTAIYSSPILRTIQTTNAIAKNHNLKIINVPELLERNYGVFEGLTHDELKSKVPDVEDQWAKQGIDWKPPKGESMRELQERAIKGFNSLIKNHNDEDVLLMVSHGSTLKAIIHYFHGGKLEDIFHTTPLENAEVVEVIMTNGKVELINLEKTPIK